jgi:LmbE family N-acetylglucosaminyl deacetylase
MKLGMLSILDLTRVKRPLCLGAHCDDIEIEAGGTRVSAERRL